MTTVLLMVPGQTDWFADERLQGDISLPMNDFGVVTMARNVARLKARRFHRIAVSESEGALQAGEILGKTCGGKIEQFSEMNEPNLGVWQGMTVGEIKKRHPRLYKRWVSNPASVQPCGGESLQHCFDRIVPCFRTILRQSRNKAVGIVTGTFVNALLYCYLKDLDVQKLLSYVHQPGEFEIIEIR